VIWRKPCASHWVQKLPLDWYNPFKLVLVSGWILVCISPQAIYRKDYTVSPYLIHTTELSFRLDEHETIVSSKIDFYQNALSADKAKAMCFTLGTKIAT
jgi:hypothetical protein